MIRPGAIHDADLVEVVSETEQTPALSQNLNEPAPSAACSVVVAASFEQIRRQRDARRRSDQRIHGAEYVGASGAGHPECGPGCKCKARGDLEFKSLAAEEECTIDVEVVRLEDREL